MRFLLIALLAVSASAQPAKRALLIGIDDYTASTIPVVKTVEHRGWPDLQGSANDVRILSEMLVLRYGFERKNIIALTNQQATRAAILHAIEQQLVTPARAGDIVFYYFAGHGSQVPNAASDEPDGLDESTVPADSRRGAEDIRDKELRPRFNRILDRGARLTLLLDSCHSGGGFRGERVRGIAKAPPIVDRTSYGPRPDDRGALVLASTQDLDSAYEIRGDDGVMHGAFTWAWIRAMRDAVADEPAEETFLRAQARLRNERPYQMPAMLGNADARLRPFLGMHRRAARAVIAVESVQQDQIVVQGGWSHGLAVGSELRAADNTRVRITQLLGLGRSVAQVSAGPSTIRAGALLEIVRRTSRWYSLATPTDPSSPYHLAIRDERTKQTVDGATVIGSRIYSVVLRPSQMPRTPRYYYVFVVDSRGHSHLVFPKTGSVENRFPVDDRASSEITLGHPSAFRVVRPYGVDTYFLLSAEEPLPDPSILERDEARARRLLIETRWSLERITFESVAPTRRRVTL
ncbi:MAG: hypothetical protein DMF56_01155 [Acidobacteria bacterium]|nr:MAG: hypothetical protein DMF56_01155 [Acidobacteriota bacterium]